MNPTHPKTFPVLVVGAGVAGIQASLALAELGFEVMLVDQSPAIGGHLSRLDHQFPTDHCGMCRILPDVGTLRSARTCLRKGLFHDLIHVHTSTSIQTIQGQPGAFQVTLQRKPAFIDNARCGDCPAPCVQVCPVTMPDPFNLGLTTTQAIHRPSPIALPDTLCIDEVACTRCGACVQVCPAQAIDLHAKSTEFSVDVHAIIQSTGTSNHQPEQDPWLSFLTSSPNVITALEFERILGLAGPRRRGLRRPSDGKPVKHVAWLQCVGSRDPKHNRDHCSTICCLFALKQARLVRRIDNGSIDTTLFYMDIRGSGQGYQAQRQQAEELGVRFVRSRIQEVQPTSDGQLRIRAIQQTTGQAIHDNVDLLVLSTGQVPRAGRQEWEKRWRGSAEGAFSIDDRSPVPGVFFCGSALGPMEISDALVSANAAADRVHQLLLTLKKVETIEESIEEKRASSSSTLVIRCHCHLDSALDSTSDSALDSALDDEPLGCEVIRVDSPCLHADAFRSVLSRSTHDRVVVAACGTHAQRRMLRAICEQEAFDPALVQVVDARHSLLPVRTAVAALEAIPLPRIKKAKTQLLHAPRVLVLGSDPAGMQAALSLADRGVQVDLVETQSSLESRFSTRPGGIFDDERSKNALTSLCARVVDSPHIDIHLGARVIESTPLVGQRRTIIQTKEGKRLRIEHGAMIVATSGRDASTSSYGHGTCERIITQGELENRLHDAGLEEPQTLVMIQCVDSREPGAHEYCSCTCCLRALNNAKKLRERYPDLRIVILYRDMMVTGEREREYSEARRSGVLFITYESFEKPVVEVISGKPRVVVRDPVLGRPLRIDADWLVLSTAVEPWEDAKEVAGIFGLSTDQAGFFQEQDRKWRPLELTYDGVLGAGLCLAPQPFDALVDQGRAAAHKAYAWLHQRTRRESALVPFHATVMHSLCARCGQCIEACPFGARRLAQDRLWVDPLVCRVCGACVTACPNGAAHLPSMSQKQVFAQLEQMMQPIERKEARESLMGSKRKGKP